MCNTPKWLPPLVSISNYDGDWKLYLEALYNYFKQDFIDSKPFFKGRRLGLKKHPVERGKEATFWHFISEGSHEDERMPDFRRCERVRWPRPIIENAEATIIKIWENSRRNEKRILLWLEEQEYLVVLVERKDYLLPWTAYLVLEEHRKRKLRKEYEAYKKANAAPSK